MRLTRGRGQLTAALCLLVAACTPLADDPLGPPRGDALVSRGRELVRGLAACGLCHGERPHPRSLLIGGREFSDRYGLVAAPNLTPAETGLREWSWRDIANALRLFRTKDAGYLSHEAHDGYEWLASSDLDAIVAYLRTLPPVDNEVSRRSLSFLSRNIFGFTEGARGVNGYVPGIDPKNVAAYGRYLVRHVARCGACHDAPRSVFGGGGELEGGKVIRFGDTQRLAPSLTPSGIGDWSRDDMLTYLRTGATPTGETTDGSVCPTPFFAEASSRDLEAIVAYLIPAP